VNISIAIATYNRSRELAITLASLEQVDFSGGEEFEILVIDNNSTDDTLDITERFAARFGGRLRYIREARQGLSHARNRAIAESQYEIVAFLDDDVDVNVKWFKNLAAVYGQGSYAAVGGRAFLSTRRRGLRGLGRGTRACSPRWSLVPTVALRRPTNFTA
jgi:glycosyltransferase involved in cell wall biosynthesis